MYQTIHRGLSVLTQETRYRPLLRVMLALYVLTLGLLLSLNIIDAATDVDAEAILQLQRSNLAVGVFSTLLGLTGPASVILLWVLMLHHWRMHDFKSVAWKNLWLAALLLGNILLTPAYYLAVFEWGKTLQASNEGKQAERSRVN